MSRTLLRAADSAKSLTPKENRVRLLFESALDFYSYSVDSVERDVINRNQKGRLSYDEWESLRRERDDARAVRPVMDARGLMGSPGGAVRRGFRAPAREANRLRPTLEDLKQLSDDLQRRDEREYRRHGSYDELERAWPPFRRTWPRLAGALTAYGPGCGTAKESLGRPAWELDWRLDLSEPVRRMALKMLTRYMPDPIRVPLWVVEADDLERARSTWLSAYGKGSDPEALRYRDSTLAVRVLLGSQARELAVIHRLDEKSIAGLPMVKFAGKARRALRDELIRYAAACGDSPPQIARTLGVSTSTVTRAIRDQRPPSPHVLALCSAIEDLGGLSERDWRMLADSFREAA